jgi:hypothetical protein
MEYLNGRALLKLLHRFKKYSLHGVYICWTPVKTHHLSPHLGPITPMRHATQSHQ